jgi:hypothetical protein
VYTCWLCLLRRKTAHLTCQAVFKLLSAKVFEANVLSYLICPSHSSWHDHPRNILRRIQIAEPPLRNVRYCPVTSSLSETEMSSKALFQNSLNLRFSLRIVQPFRWVRLFTIEAHLQPQDRPWMIRDGHTGPAFPHHHILRTSDTHSSFTQEMVNYSPHLNTGIYYRIHEKAKKKKTNSLDKVTDHISHGRKTAYPSPSWHSETCKKDVTGQQRSTWTLLQVWPILFHQTGPRDTAPKEYISLYVFDYGKTNSWPDRQDTE